MTDEHICGAVIESARGVRMVPVPPGAPAALSEGFCPQCLVPLGGDTGRCCPGCKAYWHPWND